MLIVHVHVQVKPEFVDDFKVASVENAHHSVKEPGIARFDVIQRSDDPARFVLIEVYRTPQAPSQHKATGHYQAWRDKVAPMMAEPRTGVQYTSIYPGEEGW